MIGISVIEIAILWFGLAPSLIGIPPGPEDPLMAKVAPESCVFYTTWAPMAKPDAASGNQTEQLLAEPEIQRVIATLDRQIQENLRRIALRQNDPMTTLIAQLTPKLFGAALSQAGAFYLEKIELAPEGPPHIQAAAILRLGDQEKEIGRLLLSLQETSKPPKVTQFKADGATFHSLQFDSEAPLISWGIWNGCLVVGAGENATQQLIARAKKEPPKWLSELKQNMAVPRRATLTYVNVPPLLQLARDVGGSQVSAMLEAGGLANVQMIAAATGLDDSGFVARSVLALDGPPEGMLAILENDPLTKDDLRHIPADSTVAFALRLDLAKTLNTVLEALDKVEPQTANEVREGVSQVGAMLQTDVQRELLPAFGTTWSVYTGPGAGNLIFGWTATVSVRNRARLQRTHDMLLGMIRGALGERGPKIRSLRSGEHDVYYLVIPESIAVAPAWTLTDDEFVVGLFPQSITAHLQAANNAEALVDSEALEDVFAEGQSPIAISYVDLKPIFELAYPAVQAGVQLAVSEAMRNGALERAGLDIDIGLLPSAATISRHLTPSVGSVQLSDLGFEVVRHQSVPGGSVGANAPLAVALLLPAIQQSRQAAMRMRTANNLRQIGLAIHNYADTYASLPAAYNTDKQGKPLLSWRVRLLPYLDQQPLYEQFHHDEPWDSEHNRKLIAQIPQVYQTPGSKASVGMTNYVAPRGENTIIVEPAPGENGKSHPRGSRFADIVDGTSNTIAVVEGSDASAVIWTKPDDWEYNPENPLQGLMGLYRDGAFVLFADGSVQFLSNMLDPAVFSSLFTRNGGEVVEIP